MGLRWLITGGCGFIGTSLIAKLVAEGIHTIRVVDDFSVGQKEDLAEVTSFEMISSEHIVPVPKNTCQLVEGNILNAELAVLLTKDIDVIVHLAANTGVPLSIENPRRDCMLNVVGVMNYLEAAKLNKVDRFIFASSNAPIGEAIPPVHEEIVPHPISPYGASKLAGEAYCSAYFNSFNVDTVALRFGNVYGPRSKHKSSVVAKFINCVLIGKDLEVYGDGEQTRDFVYIDDLLNAIYQAAYVKDVGGEVFQIATSYETSINELLIKLLKVFESYGIKNIESHNLDVRLGDIQRNFSDTSKAKRFLGWEAKIDFYEGLSQTVEWFLKECQEK